MTNLDKVRDGLDEAQRTIIPLGVSHPHMCDRSTVLTLAEAQHALEAHEQEVAKLVRVAAALMDRPDFWDSVAEDGWILPAEFDLLEDALRPFEDKK